MRYFTSRILKHCSPQLYSNTGIFKVLYSDENFLLLTNNTRLSAGRSQSRTTQNEQATHRRRLLPRRYCTNHGPVRDVLARRTSRLDYALFVKGTFNRIIVWLIVMRLVFLYLETKVYFSIRCMEYSIQTFKKKAIYSLKSLSQPWYHHIQN